MGTARKARRFVLPLSFAAAIALILTLTTGARAQNASFPDLSGVLGRITGPPPPKTAGVFSSDLAVPTVDPDAAAGAVGREVQEEIETAAGQPRPELQNFLKRMPDMLNLIEKDVVKGGFAARDLGVAAGFFFATDYQAATGRAVPDAASDEVIRKVALATAAQYGPRFQSLSASHQESVYVHLLVAPAFLYALGQQYEKAGLPEGAQLAQREAAGAFRKVFGVPATSIVIEKSGRIVHESGEQPAARIPASGGQALQPPPQLTAKVYVMYMIPILGVPISPIHDLLLFPDGKAVNGLPNRAIPDFQEQTLIDALGPAYVGHWTQSGDHLAITIQGGTINYVKDPSGGWADPHQRQEQWGIYYPVIPATPALIAGAWKCHNMLTAGFMGGGTPMVVTGSNGNIVFSPDGTFEMAGQTLAQGTTANMGPAFKVGPSVLAGGERNESEHSRWRLDGLLLSTLDHGRRSVELLYVLPHFTGKGQPPSIAIEGVWWSRPESKH